MARTSNGLQHLIMAFGSAAALAKAIGVDRSAVTRWAGGRRMPSKEAMLEVIRKAPAYGLSREEAADCIGAERVVPDRLFVDEEIDELVKAESKRTRRRRAAA